MNCPAERMQQHEVEWYHVGDLRAGKAGHRIRKPCASIKIMIGMQGFVFAWKILPLKSKVYKKEDDAHVIIQPQRH